VTLPPGHDPEAFRYLLENPVGEVGAQLASLFEADAFAFGETVYLSVVVAAVNAMPGVQQVKVRRFRRWGDPDEADRSQIGTLELAASEIPRLGYEEDNPQRGVFQVRFEVSR
ncbi:MAG: hypothetical protein MI919_17685, partial [Holophagales bacterium]|nr:hypothetical protein [Holophagales bacterium]